MYDIYIYIYIYISVSLSMNRWLTLTNNRPLVTVTVFAQRAMAERWLWVASVSLQTGSSGQNKSCAQTHDAICSFLPYKGCRHGKPYMHFPDDDIGSVLKIGTSLIIRYRSVSKSRVCVLTLIWSLWNLTGLSTAVLPRPLSNFKSIPMISQPNLSTSKSQELFYIILTDIKSS